MAVLALHFDSLVVVYGRVPAANAHGRTTAEGSLYKELLGREIAGNFDRKLLLPHATNMRHGTKALLPFRRKAC